MIQPLFKHPKHCVDILRESAKIGSQREFVARGANTSRCPSCLMSEFACFCDHRQTSNTAIQFTLLFHYTEIHKPTNSGRLIADLFPNQTQAFIWSRTSPCEPLTKRIAKYQSNSIILYPETQRRLETQRHIEKLNHSNTPLHVIVLDATWRLASKMLHQSRWLDDIPTLGISEDIQKTFMVRQAKHDHQFATAEVVAMLMAQANEPQQGKLLEDYYQIFNHHSLWSRKRAGTPKTSTDT